MDINPELSYYFNLYDDGLITCREDIINKVGDIVCGEALICYKNPPMSADRSNEVEYYERIGVMANLSLANIIAEALQLSGREISDM